ncbi:unnamed protein product [Calypogeia fissa]
MLVLSIEEEESAYALQFFELKGENLPAYVIQTDKGEKYVSKNTKPEQLAPWLNDFLADKLKVNIKSESVPLFNDQPVKVVVAYSFNKVEKLKILGSSRVRAFAITAQEEKKIRFHHNQ